MINYNPGDIVEITTQQDGYEKIIHGFNRSVKCEVVTVHPELKVKRIAAGNREIIQRVEYTDIKLATITRASLHALWSAATHQSPVKQQRA
jgi:hypothetical protein